MSKLRPYYPDDPLPPMSLRALGCDIPLEDMDEDGEWTIAALRRHYEKLGKPCPHKD